MCQADPAQHHLNQSSNLWFSRAYGFEPDPSRDPKITVSESNSSLSDEGELKDVDEPDLLKPNGVHPTKHPPSYAETSFTEPTDQETSEKSEETSERRDVTKMCDVTDKSDVTERRDVTERSDVTDAPSPQAGYKEPSTKISGIDDGPPSYNKLFKS